MSFEFFPPRTAEGETALLERAAKLAALKPAWVDVTWGAGGSTAEKTFDLCVKLQQQLGFTAMMHLTCVNLGETEVYEILKKCKVAGIRNILALRGDRPAGVVDDGTSSSAFPHAVDLVRFVRLKFGDFFSIGVAGYPEGHPEAASLSEDLARLKEKVEAGADFVITQLFYDVNFFVNFVEAARAIGVTVPIIPGVMPIVSYASLMKITGLCKARVPEELLAKLALVKDDAEAVRDLGIDLSIKMCRSLREHGVNRIHFYTMNLEFSCIHIINRLDS